MAQPWLRDDKGRSPLLPAHGIHPPGGTGMIIDPLQDGKSQIQLIDSMGNDLSVVNDARASFNRVSDELTEGDRRLIRYLIQHEHTSPLRGVVFKFKVRAPLFVARQWWKHVLASNHNDEQIGWNETSFRYVAIDEPEFYVPQTFRKQSENNKQGSEGEVTTGFTPGVYVASCQSSYENYQRLLSYGVCREQARGVLPSAFYTSWVWTASLQAVLHFVDLRKGHGAQQEIGAYAIAIQELIAPIVPETMAAWEAVKG